MTSPVNYVDLFDRLYPEQHLSGITDDSQINVDDLNQRYATIRANQRTMMMALNSIYSAQSDGSHFKDFMQPFWEIALSKKFDLSPAITASLRYRAGFDPGGNTLTFPENRTGFHLHDCGSSLLNDMTEVMVYINGKLVPPSAKYVHVAQGGFSIYVKECIIPSTATSAHVIVLRKFNQLGLTRSASTIYKSDTATALPFDILITDLLSLGNIYDLRYYKVFHRLSTDRYFRPLDPTKWAGRFSVDNASAIFTIINGAGLNEEFIVLNTAEYWKYEFDGQLTEDSNVTLIDLIDGNSLPAPVWSIEDLDVFVDGRLMRPYTDYIIQWGSPSSKQHAPRLVLRGVPTGQRHILVQTNAPHDPLCPMIREDSISDPDAIFRTSPAERELRLIEDVGIVYSNGYLCSVGDDINVVADNYAIHLGGLPDTNFLYYRARFVLTPAQLEGAKLEGGYKTPLENFVNLVGLRLDGSPADGSSLLGGFDFIESYRYNAGVTAVPSNPIPWPEIYFNAMYFWVRDEQTSARIAGEPLDCRETSLANLAVYDPWKQEDFELSMDCRAPISLDAGYVTDREVNCRNS